MSGIRGRISYERLQRGVPMPLKVAIVMGSDSDWNVVEATCKALNELEVHFEVNVISAHRSPDKLREYVQGAEERGIGVFIAAAGGAAHLPGVIAANTVLPVIGIPIQTSTMGGLDSLLSIAQMPGGVPVGTMSVGSGGARNAGIYAAQILAVGDEALRQRLVRFKENLAQETARKNDKLRALVAELIQ